MGDAGKSIYLGRGWQLQSESYCRAQFIYSERFDSNMSHH